MMSLLRATSPMVQVFSLALVLVFTGPGASASDPQNERATFDLLDYVPLREGNEWTFETIVHSRGYVLERAEDTWKVAGGTRVRGRMTARVEMDETNSFSPTGRPPKLYITCDKKGLRLWGHVLDEGRRMPRIYLPRLVHIGTDRDVYDYLAIGPETRRKVHCEIEVESNDRVMTPAGLFTECLRISVTLKYDDDEWPTLMKWRCWFAKDIGPVTSVLETEGYPASRGPVKVQERLIRASVGGLEIGPPMEE